MRGNDTEQASLISYVSLEERIAQDHPLRKVRELVDGVLKSMDGEFTRMYSQVGRPSIPPERLLRALLLQIFYTVRSERSLMEQLDYNLLFRRFVGLKIDEPVWNHAVFSKNRDRLLNEEVAREFFARVNRLAAAHMSDEHFTVDGTLLEAWASHKSFQRKDGKARRTDRISMATSARTTLMNPGPIRKRACIRRAMARRPGSAISATS